MARLLMIVEGQTEQVFAGEVLAPHLGARGVYLSKAALVGPKSRRPGRIGRGGCIKYGPIKKDIERWLKQESSNDFFLTTMIDLYALPDDFPGSAEATKIDDAYQRVACLEKRWGEDIGSSRFVPYIQLHEFEALLFAAPAQFAKAFPETPAGIAQLNTVVANAFDSNPELIDDGQDTAPSKQIANIYPQYAAAKPVAGPQIAAAIGLDQLRSKCRHFSEWLERLEALSTASRTNS